MQVLLSLPVSGLIRKASFPLRGLLYAFAEGCISYRLGQHHVIQPSVFMQAVVRSVDSSASVARQKGAGPLPPQAALGRFSC